MSLESQCRTVDFTSVDTRSSEREAATFSRMHEITAFYQRSAIYQNMLDKVEQSLQRADKPAIPFKSKDSPSGAAKLEVLLRSVFSCEGNDYGDDKTRIATFILYFSLLCVYLHFKLTD